MLLQTSSKWTSDFNPRPREGGRRYRNHQSRAGWHFNPRPREGGRLGFHLFPVRQGGISIHAPARGGDWCNAVHTQQYHNFNPRPREGGRPVMNCAPGGTVVFQSTPPRGGATSSGQILDNSKSKFQSTPPRGGATGLNTIQFESNTFQSTPPRGGATICLCNQSYPQPFQSTPPRGGATFTAATTLRRTTDFNPRPREGGRQQRCTVLPADL